MCNYSNTFIIGRWKSLKVHFATKWSIPSHGGMNIVLLAQTSSQWKDVLTRRVPLVEHEIFRLPEDMSSLPVYSVVRVTRSLVFCAVVCILFFVLLLFAIVLSVLVRFTDSDYPFGIVNIFSHMWDYFQQLTLWPHELLLIVRGCKGYKRKNCLGCRPIKKNILKSKWCVKRFWWTQQFNVSH